MRRLRCAIYTRKSTEEGLEQDFNSLDAQREACVAYVKSQAAEGWCLIPRVYDDGGYSGGTIDRPALQSLLTDVKAKRIDIIVVHKIDRLTRSLLDFAKLVEVFEAADTSFVSVTQSFNTTSSMGRLTLNMLLSFAQFEREITAERIRDKIAASKAKGMWMGGYPPLGYQPFGRTLQIVDKHATLVREIYERYLRTGNVRILEHELLADGIRVPERITLSGRSTGGGKFTRGQIYKILSNPVYVGKIAHHGKIYGGQHEAIVTDALWETVRQKLEANRQGYHSDNRQSGAALLTGLVWTEDGRRLKSNHACKGKKRYRYYVADRSPNQDGLQSFAAMRIPNRELDSAVIHSICRVLHDPLALLIDGGVAVAPVELGNIRERGDALIAAVHSGDRFTVRSLISRVTIGPSILEIRISLAALVEGLGFSAVPANATVAVRSAIRLARTGKAVRLIQPNGRSGAQQRPNMEMIDHLLKARAWWEELREGNVRVADIARREGLNDSWVSRMVRLNFLAPSVVEAIMNGSIPEQIGPDLLRQPSLPLNWEAQNSLFGLG